MFRLLNLIFCVTGIKKLDYRLRYAFKIVVRSLYCFAEWLYGFPQTPPLLSVSFFLSLVNWNYIIFQVIKYSGPSLWPANAKYFGRLLVRRLSERAKNEIITTTNTYWELMIARNHSKYFIHVLTYLILVIYLRDSCYYYPEFPYEQREARRDKVTCPSLHS